MKSTQLILLVSLLMVGCGRDGNYSNLQSPGPSDSERTQDAAISPDATAEDSDLPVADDQAPNQIQTAERPQAQVQKVENKEKAEPALPRWRSWEAYEEREATKLRYWKLVDASAESRVSDFDFFKSLRVALTMDSAEEEGTWTTWGYFKHGKKESAPEKIQRQFEEAMDGYQYFIRVPKFRAPISATDGAYYTWYVAVAPSFSSKADFTKASKTAPILQVGIPVYLEPGASAGGSEEIIPIPRRLVQSAFGYWNESVVLQYGVIEVSKPTSSTDTMDNVKRQFITAETFDFYHLKENEIVSRQVHWMGKNSEKGTAIDLQIWKGDWKTNRD